MWFPSSAKRATLLANHTHAILGADKTSLQVNVMADDEHLAIIKQGAEVWNDWRNKNPEIQPDFSEAVLPYANLRGADLRDANLINANLINANLSGADLVNANLINANLIDADLIDADLSGAYLGGADL